MSRPDGGPEREPGPFRFLLWLAGAAHWCLSSRERAKAWAFACLPWAACAALRDSAHAFSIIAAVAMYAQFSGWSVLCTERSFQNLHWDAAPTWARWSGSLRAMRRPALAFCAVAAAGAAWMQLCMEATGLGPMFDELGSASTRAAIQATLAQYWAKDGLDGIAWGLAAQQAGLAALCSIWCLIPFKAMEAPEASAKELLAFGWSRLRAAPGAMLGLGACGSALAQLGLAIPLAALASGIWFMACAFAWREAR